MSTHAVILVTGRDPQRYADDSHCGYVRAHGYAATQAGYDVSILCLSENDRIETTAYGTVYAAKTRVHTVRQNQIPMHSPNLTRALTNLLRTLVPRPTIIHGFGLWGHPAVRVSKRFASAGIPCTSIIGSYTTYLDESQSQWRGLIPAAGPRVYAIHALEQAWIRAVISRYERVVYRNADRILVNYRSVGRMITSRFGNDLSCSLIPYTIEKEFLKPQQTQFKQFLSPNGAPVIVSVARHQPRKGIDVLLLALRTVKDFCNLSFSAHIVGGGSLLERHRKLLDSLNLSDCVTIHGVVPSVDEFLGQADIFILPSREEQSGSLALIEAMRAGVACVASACDGIPEDVSHLADAWLTIPGDHQSLADGIIALLQDSSLRKKIACTARRTFETQFSANAFSEAIDAVYRTC